MNVNGAEQRPLERPPWYKSYVAPKRYIWISIIFGVVLGGTIAIAAGIPQAIGIILGPVFGSATDLIWRKKMPPSEDVQWGRPQQQRRR